MQALREIMLAGGPIVLLLVFMSLGSVALIILKVLQLRGVAGGDARRADAITRFLEGDRHGAVTALDAGTAPSDRITQAAMRALDKGLPRATLEAELEWRGNTEMTQMQRHIRLLELIAMVSPLLGLLGTVVGMIQAFQELALAQGAANASLLAAGIWQALLTTAAGLLVAIPAAVAASLLAEKVDRAGASIEAAVGQLLSRMDSKG